MSRTHTVVFSAALLSFAAVPPAPHPSVTDGRFDPIAFLIGTWATDGPVGLPGIPTMTFAWGDEQRLIRYHGTRPLSNGGSAREYEGIITFDGVRQQLAFTASYDQDVVETGAFEIHGAGSVTRHFGVTYSPGTRLPWSDGAVAGPEGATLRFRQSWTLQDSNTIHGEFLMERDGVWAQPDFGPDGPHGPIVWRRLAVTDGAWRRDLEFRTRGSGLWLTSNAAYRTASGNEAEAYGMRYEPRFGNTSIRGCLWGQTAGNPTEVAWHFFAAWDPSDGVIWLHQSGADGTVGIGYETPGDGSSVQTFTTPSGQTFSVRHQGRRVGADTLITESFDWSEGAWVPRRTYTWVRQAEVGNAPC